MRSRCAPRLLLGLLGLLLALAVAARAAPVVVSSPTTATDSAPPTAWAGRRRNLATAAATGDDELVRRIQSGRERSTGLASSRVSRKTELQNRLGRTQASLDKQLRLRIEAARSSVQRLNAEKLDWMRAQAARSSSGVIAMTGDQFKKYVFEGPRPYHVFLQLTALAPQHRCYLCRLYHEPFVQLAANYRQQFPAVADDSSSDPEEAPVFFVELDIDNQSREIFDALNLRQVPVLLLQKSKATPEAKPRKLAQFLKNLPARYRFQAMKPDLEASDLAGFLSKNSNVQVNIEEPLNRAKLAVIAVLLVSLPYLFFRFYRQILKLREQLMLIVMMSWMFYGWCISGSMFNIIRQTPFSRFEEGGQTFIARANRDQYGAESWIVTFLVLTAAGSALILSVLSGPSVAWLPANSLWHSILGTDGSGSNSSGSSGNRRKSGLDYLRSPLIYVLVLILMWFEYLSVYTTKNPYYRMGMVG